MTTYKHPSESFPDLTNTTLRKIGEALGGRHWQADIARETSVSKSMITRFLKDAGDPDRRVPTYEFAHNLDRVLVDKIEDVAGYLGQVNSPLHDNAQVLRAKEKILEGVKLLRKFNPKIKREPIISERENPPGAKPKKKAKK